VVDRVFEDDYHRALCVQTSLVEGSWNPDCAPAVWFPRLAPCPHKLLGQIVSDYRFATRWDIDAPITQVWAEIERPENWAEWWPGLVEVRELEVGDALGVGAVKRFTFKSFLPYTLSFQARITEVVPPRLFRIAAVGELEGIGTYELREFGGETRASLTWQVRTTKTWMNLLAPVAAPLFTWNHDKLMEKGGQGLSKRLGANVVLQETSGSRPIAALAPVVIGVALVGWLVLRRARRR
jgi:uncharacterized protein YndB with AHSA1/START domain